MKKIVFYSLLGLLITFITSCADEPNPAVGPLTLHFDNIVGNTNLQLNTSDTPYTNSNEEPYKITSLRYYISNIKLKRDDGSVFEDKVKSDGSAGYYLVDEADAESQDITLQNIPAGSYTEVTFTVGVDANQVDQGAQTGPLDPANGLFWSWNAGYIFMAVEGVAPASTETDNVFQYHVGGYADVNNINTITLTFNGDAAPVRAEHEPEVHLLFDVNKFFDGPGASVSFTTNASRHTPAACEDIAGNIPDAFVVDHIHEN